jgi:hypothetical protein
MVTPASNVSPIELKDKRLIDGLRAKAKDLEHVDLPPPPSIKGSKSRRGAGHFDWLTTIRYLF